MPDRKLHPSTEALLEFFDFSHLSGRRAHISRQFAGLAEKMITELGDSAYPAEVTTGLRKLLEAKDCFVRASLVKAHDR